MSKILVIGSSNTDLIAKVSRFPLAGETVTGNFFMQAMGGKGANQALAAHRLGGNVKFVACLGNDANGKNALQYYRDQGLDVSLVKMIDNVPTGTAMILVNAEGENCIVITPGANHEVSQDFVGEIYNEIRDAAFVVLQMEIPFETVKKICEIASASQTSILLNVAPARKIDPQTIGMVDILVVNETEIEILSGQKIERTSEEAVIDVLLAMGARTVILTLGKKGCLARNATWSQFFPAFEVEAVDSTAAGDTFCGALVARLNRGEDLAEAIEFATAASAICVTSIGAQPSIPAEAEVKAFQASHKSERRAPSLRNGQVDKKWIL